MKSKLLSKIGLLSLVLLPLISACTMGDWNMFAAQPEPPEPPGSADPMATTVCLGDEAIASYELIFEATWSAETHPNVFPSNPHFSGLIGATHDDSYNMWEAGGIATQGIENMAETGSKSPLASEIEGRILVGDAEFLLSGGGIFPSPGSVILPFEISEQYPLVSVVSMIAPSPDWFVGVDRLRLCDELGWAEEIVIDLLPWDSGTDSGLFYRSVDADVTPHEPIALLTGNPVEVDGEVPPFGTFTFRRTISEE